MKVQAVACGPAANESERKALEYLKSRLIGEGGDDCWFLLTNLMFSASRHRQADEIDIVAIGPPGVRVIEVKHWSATWVKRNQEVAEQDAHRVTMKARRLGTTLRKRVPHLPHVDGVFLITEDRSRAKALEGEKRGGVTFYTLPNWKETLGLALPTTLSGDEIRLLASSLGPDAELAVGDTPKRIADYVGLAPGSTADDRFHRIYRAEHRSRRDRVILHLYDLSAREGAKANETARREFEVLLRLQDRPWAPRIVDSFQDVPGYAGEICFFTVADPVAPSLEDRSTDSSWSPRERLAFARDAVRALGEFSEREPLVHRSLSPRTVLVGRNNTPVFTDFRLTRVPEAVTVGNVRGPESDDRFLAPEVRAQGLGAADGRSDIWSLCKSLQVLFESTDAESSQVAEILVRGTEEKPAARSSLKALEVLLAKLLGEKEPPPASPRARFWSEGQEVRFRNHDYRIVSRLGSGGVGSAFKVVRLERETGQELGAYVAKTVSDEETGKRILTAYQRAHPHLRHSGLSTIFEIAEQWSDRSFVALLTWVEGEPLGEFRGLVGIPAEDLGLDAEELAVRWLREASEALGVLHRNGLVHGDISPSNLIVSDNRIVVTDYDCVIGVGERAVAPGTVAYCSPSFLEEKSAQPADDFYALAASFFSVLFNREPFRFGSDLAKERGLNWQGMDRSAFGERVAAFLERATDPDPSRRFADAGEALATLDPPTADPEKQATPDPQAAGVGERTAHYHAAPDQQVELTDNEVEWLESLLRAYPGSRLGNDETRGLDTDFAERTYVPTNLEERLEKDIREGTVQLVVLSGNAGDGKTALLQRLARRLGLGEHGSAERIIEGRTEDGLTVRLNLDGSAAWKEKSADDLLDEFLEPFQEGRSEERIAHLLAVNDGRLLEWIEREETPLTETLENLLDGEPAPDAAHIRFVDLNQRSLVGSIASGSSDPDAGFVHRLLDSLYGGEEAAAIWAPCRTCRARPRCEVWRATRLFGPDNLDSEDRPAKTTRRRARERLIEALQAVHLRGEAQITMRELRATLVHVLFGVHFCTDYHASAEQNGAESPAPYFDRVFSPESPLRQGEVIRDLARLDPALESHPRIDRRLVFDSASTNADSRTEEVDLDAARRRAFFEWTEGRLEQVAEDPNALPLAAGRHFARFRRFLTSGAPDRDLTEDLCRGISRLEALPRLALHRGRVPLRIVGRTPTETVFWVEKDPEDFALEVNRPSAVPGLDQLPREAVLTYRDRERLPLGAELFSSLLDLSAGIQLAAESTDDVFAQLAIFVQRIAREDERRLFAWTPMDEQTVHELRIETDSEPVQTIVLRPADRRGSD